MTDTDPSSLGETRAAAEAPLWRKTTAWAVHLFSASGLLCCLLAIEAALEDDWRRAFAWLVVAVLIDAIDGTLARLAGVKEVLPAFDGALLDNLVDYVSYVIVPALILLRADLLPPQVSFAGALAICLASAYQFCQSEAKTADHYFKGFPSYWNVAVLYLLALNLSRLFNLAVVATLVVLVFVPVKYIYPSRTPRYRRLTLVMTAAWALTAVALVWQLPYPSQALVRASLVYVVYYVGMSLYLTLERSASAP